MKQILHILAKDARYLWAEILLSIAVTAAFALACPANWRGAEGMHYFGYMATSTSSGAQLFVGILELLVFVGWWLLISRLVHGDRLVGDRQFWLTRPYEWKKLLAAKALFLLVFLYLPLFIAQCALLAAAGFSPLSHLGGLLFNLLLISGLVILPLVAIATVTSNFARMTLVLLGVLLAIAALLALNSSRIDLESITLPWENDAYLALLLCLCAIATVSQYATRRTRVSVLLLVAFPVLFFFLGEFLVPYQVLVDRAYPVSASAADAPAQLSYVPSSHVEPLAYVARLPRQVGIQFPFAISRIDDRSVVIPDAVMATIEAPDGFRWNSGWQTIYATQWSPEDESVNVGLSMPLAIYDRLRSLPLSVRLTLALTQARAGKVTSVSLPAGSFSVPDFGVCRPQKGLSDPNQAGGILCLSALREPRLTQIQLVAHNAGSTCDSASTDAGVPYATWQGSLDAWPAQFGISSVKFPFGAWPMKVDREGPVIANLHLCRGTPITFTRYDLIRRSQVAVTIEAFQLPALTPDQRIVITNP
jgi:hypothetical protein